MGEFEGWGANQEKGIWEQIPCYKKFSCHLNYSNSETTETIILEKTAWKKWRKCSFIRANEEHHQRNATLHEIPEKERKFEENAIISAFSTWICTFVLSCTIIIRTWITLCHVFLCISFGVSQSVSLCVYLLDFEYTYIFGEHSNFVARRRRHHHHANGWPI